MTFLGVKLDIVLLSPFSYLVWDMFNRGEDLFDISIGFHKHFSQSKEYH